MTANTRVRFRILKNLLLPLLVFCGCVSSKPPSPRPESGPPATSGYGYALLFDLMGDQKNVSKLLIIKRERPEFGSLIKEIADRSAAAHKQLERFEKAERSLNLKGRGLPAAEVRTRESISKARGKELITDKGKYFEVHLLLAQNEALTYGAHLAAVTATMEDNLERIRFLQQLSSDLTQLQQRVVAMLMANYSWSPPRQ